MQFLLWFLIVLFVLYDLFLALKLIEYIYCASVLHIPPFVASIKKQRCMVADIINTHYSDAKNIVDVGSGFGGLMRYLARHTNANVYGVECMPFCAYVSRFLDMIWFRKNHIKTIKCDVFEYLRDTDIVFDVMVAYFGPCYTDKLLKYSDRFRVLVSIDFAVENRTPKYVIDCGSGYTRYLNVLYPHKIFVYENF